MFSVFTWKKSFGSKKWCGKRCEGERRFIPSVFYMLSFHAFLKRKTVKRALLQTDNIFSPQIKKHPALRGHKNFRNFRELNQTFLPIFSKRNIFLHFKTTFFFLFQFAVLTRARYLLFQVALCNHLTTVFAPLKAISTFKPYCTPL